MSNNGSAIAFIVFTGITALGIIGLAGTVSIPGNGQDPFSSGVDIPAERASHVERFNSKINIYLENIKIYKQDMHKLGAYLDHQIIKLNPHSNYAIDNEQCHFLLQFLTKIQVWVNTKEGGKSEDSIPEFILDEIANAYKKQYVDAVVNWSKQELGLKNGTIQNFNNVIDGSTKFILHMLKTAEDYQSQGRRDRLNDLVRILEIDKSKYKSERPIETNGEENLAAKQLFDQIDLFFKDVIDIVNTDISYEHEKTNINFTAAKHKEIFKQYITNEIHYYNFQRVY